MKPLCFVGLFFVILAAATLANLIALKIAADQVQASADTSPLLKLLRSI